MNNDAIPTHLQPMYEQMLSYDFDRLVSLARNGATKSVRLVASVIVAERTMTADSE